MCLTKEKFIMQEILYALHESFMWYRRFYMHDRREVCDARDFI